MKVEVQNKFSTYKDNIQKLYNIRKADEMFNVDPTESQVLIDDVKLTDEFLERINVHYSR